MGGSLLLVCAFLTATASARQAPPAVAPQAPTAQTPAAVPVPAPAPAKSPRAIQGGSTPRATRAVPTPVTPREVVTVVHRLTGWKLLAWLAASGPTLELDEMPSAADAHTNIVAGYIYDDGRSVAARLPQAEAELESFALPPTPPAFFAAGGIARQPEPEYLLVTADGRRVEAKFVGLDSSTGLTLLEAKEPLLSGAPTGDMGDTDDPTVGQRVLFYAPAPAAGPAPQPEPRYIYLSIDQKEGLLKEVSRAPSGKPSRVVASANVSQEWTGAVAANELGEIVGIVSQSRAGETQIVPIATVKDACERVLKLRGSAPQPWLGARGGAAFQSSIDEWVSFGWRPELARPHIEKRQGVFLTSVAPGTPAALAGLKAGDLIAGVGARTVRGVEDLSMTLTEAGVGSMVDLTVWRALEPQPVKVTVELKGAKNPALATAEAEERAVREVVLSTQREVGELRAALNRLKGAPGGANAFEQTALSTRLAGSEERLAIFKEKLELVRAKVNMARAFSFTLDVPSVWPAVPPAGFIATTRLQVFGLNAIGLSPRGASRLGAKGGMLVVAVRPESPAAASGLLSGDVIETVNGAPLARKELRRLLGMPETSTLTFGLVREGRRLNVNFTPSFGNEQQR